MAKRSRRPVTPRPAPATPPAASQTPATPATPSDSAVDSSAESTSESTVGSSATSATKARTTAKAAPALAAASTTAPPQTTRAKRNTTRARRAVAPQPTFFERYRAWIIGGAAVIGLLVVGYFLFFANKGPQGNFVASGPKYVCDSLLTPAPNGTVPPELPTLAATPTLTSAPTAAPSILPSVAGSPGASGSPVASGSSVESATPSASPTTLPTASPAPTASPTPTPVPTAPLGQTTDILGRSHIVNAGQTIEYGFCPPTSGDHYNISGVGPIRAAVYPSAAEQPPGGWIHNLEHGWIVMLYRCPGGQPGQQGCPTTDEMAQMQQLFNEAPTPDPATNQNCTSEVIVARFDSMNTKFAELAWGRALLTDDFNLDTAKQFAQQWMDHGTEPEKTTC